MDEITKAQVRRVHGKYGIGRYEHRTGKLLDRYENHIDIWGNLLDEKGNPTGKKTIDTNY